MTHVIHTFHNEKGCLVALFGLRKLFSQRMMSDSLVGKVILSIIDIFYDLKSTLWLTESLKIEK